MEGTSHTTPSDGLPTAEPDTDPPRPRKTKVEVAAEALKALPNLAKLCYRLLSDSRVPLRTKAVLGFAGLYFLSPVDLVPEMLFPVVGRIDDVLLLAFALHRLLDSVDSEVLEEYWDGDEDALELVSAFVAWGAELVPGPLHRLLNR